MGPLSSIVDFLTDPNGVGFPILIGIGLGAILLMMNSSTKSWRKANVKLEEGKETRRGVNLPYKPF